MLLPPLMAWPSLRPVAVVCLLACSGCVIEIGPGGSSGDTAGAGGEGGSTTSVHRDPDAGSAGGPPLDRAQQARMEEVEQYILQVVYQGAEVITSVELPSGDVLDFVDRDTLPALPYEVPAVPPAAVLPAALPGFEIGLTELQQIPELLDIAATATPFHRPTFWPYILGEAPDATSIEDYVAHYQVTGQPAGANRLYAGSWTVQPNRGLSGYVNQFRPEVASGSFSLLELAVTCPAGAVTQELVGVVISVDKANPFAKNQQALQDGDARLHVEYVGTAGGSARHSWDGMDGKFVANPLRVHHPGQKVPVSAFGGAQVEHLLVVFQSPVGDWWVVYNGDFLGYYPANLFTQLNQAGCGATWYGEVYNPKPGTAVLTEMGSGKFAETGLSNAAHIRAPQYYDISWFTAQADDAGAALPYQPLCYDRSLIWNDSFLLGGPGSTNPACEWP